jgi:hypothetical protein
MLMHQEKEKRHSMPRRKELSKTIIENKNCLQQRV